MKKKILASAYDVNPYKGSESGTGWNFIFQISRFNKVIAVTRKNNKSHIDRYIKENQINTDNIDFYYYDLPYVLRFWKEVQEVHSYTTTYGSFFCFFIY